MVGREAQEEMEVVFSHTPDVRGVGDVYTVNGEWGGEYRVTVYAPKRDVVNIMFRAALEAVGWKIVEGA